MPKVNKSFRLRAHLVRRLAQAAGATRSKTAILEEAIARLVATGKAAEYLGGGATGARLQQIRGTASKQLINIDLSAEASSEVEFLAREYDCSQTDIVEAAIEGCLMAATDPASAASLFHEAYSPPLKVNYVKPWSPSRAPTKLGLEIPSRPVLLDSSAIIAGLVSLVGTPSALSAKCALLLDRCRVQQAFGLLTPFGFQRLRFRLSELAAEGALGPEGVEASSETLTSLERVRRLTSGVITIVPLAAPTLADTAAQFPDLDDALAWEIVAAGRCARTSFYVAAADDRFDGFDGREVDDGITVTVLAVDDLRFTEGTMSG